MNGQLQPKLMKDYTGRNYKRKRIFRCPKCEEEICGVKAYKQHKYAEHGL